MHRNSEWTVFGRKVDLRVAVRTVLGVLLALNLAAVWMVFHPPGGSVLSLSQDMLKRQQDISHQQAALKNLTATLAKVEKAHASIEQFEKTYFLVRRTYASTLIDELGRAAKTAGIREREKSYTVEPVEGADDLQRLIINASYEGNYADLVQFISLLDRSDRLLILEALQAQPLQAGQGLGIQLKLNAILREDGSVATKEVASR